MLQMTEAKVQKNMGNLLPPDICIFFWKCPISQPYFGNTAFSNILYILHIFKNVKLKQITEILNLKDEADPNLKNE